MCRSVPRRAASAREAVSRESPVTQEKTTGRSAPEVVKSDTAWRQQLTHEQYAVTRQHGTERAFTHPYYSEKRRGMYHCVCCGAPLFSSERKFDSGTGWPSFTGPVSAEAVREHEDRTFFMRRTEVCCARCDAHLGHVFPDGPEPTGLRYCLNGVALQFRPEAEEGK
ncbi:MAG: peptide-methionine (R)-S-oxide reductase MsrB [Hyphomicrobiaceae bacterium]|nr:peptide-methionine (R)-S-oxide reductase MsrB [Hyphomicrobiaceae bacterium]